MPSNHLILFHSLLLLPSVFASIRVFCDELNWLFALGSQSLGALPSASVLPVNLQSWCPFRMAWLDLLAVQGTLSVFSSTTVQKHQFFDSQPSLWPNSCIYTWLLEKPWLWLYRPLSAVMSLLFNMLSGLAIAFLPRSKHLLISWLQSLLSVIMKPKKIKSVSASSFSPSICREWWHQMPWS